MIFTCVNCGTIKEGRLSHGQLPRFCSAGCRDTGMAREHAGEVLARSRAVAVVDPETTTENGTTVLVIVPPLTAQELMRAAVFIMTGKVQAVLDADALVKTQPWPMPDKDG